MGHIRSCVWGHVAGIKGRWPRFYSYKFLHWIGPELFLCGYSWGGAGCSSYCAVGFVGGGGGWADHFLFILLIAWFGPFRLALRGVGVGLCGVQSWELGAGCEPHLPRLILLVSFSDTLLAVSILDIVYDCRLRPLLQFRRD